MRNIKLFKIFLPTVRSDMGVLTGSLHTCKGCTVYSRYMILVTCSVHDCGVVITMFTQFLAHDVVDYSQSFVVATLSPMLLQSNAQLHACADKFFIKHSFGNKFKIHLLNAVKITSTAVRATIHVQFF